MTNDLLPRVEHMIADTAQQMRLGAPLEREFFRGFNAAYHNVRNMLKEPQPSERRLRELATVGARLAHNWYFDATENIDDAPPNGHVNDGLGERGTPDCFGFNRCPHPDCALVRDERKSDDDR